MFKCHFCQQVTPPKTTRHTVVIEVREKQYSSRRRESKRGGGGRGGFRGREEPVQDRGGRGQEISKEVAACPTCAAQHREATVIEEVKPAVLVEVTGDEASETAATETQVATEDTTEAKAE